MLSGEQKDVHYTQGKKLEQLADAVIADMVSDPRSQALLREIDQKRAASAQPEKEGA